MQNKLKQTNSTLPEDYTYSTTPKNKDSYNSSVNFQLELPIDYTEEKYSWLEVKKN